MMVHRPLRLATAAAAVALLCGCPNPNTYTTPRTLDPGQVQWQVAPEFIGVSYDVKTTAADGTTQTTNASAVSPMVPSFGARFGVADGVELGAHLMNFDSLQFDAKIRLLKGVFDIAIDPGVQGYYVSIDNTSLGVVYLHAPVLLGWNVTQKLSLVLTPGFVYSLATATVDGANGTTGIASATGVMARIGAGVDIRVAKKFAIHPEVTFLKGFGDSNALIYVGGVGFNIGAMPDYSDVP